MKIEIARIDDRMAPSGKAILRSLQNDSLPIVDLVIRESFQNSLDATLPGSDETHIDVSTKKVKTNNIAHYFEGVTTRLKELFPEDSTLISIRDSHTYGLTGEYNTSDKKRLNNSNIYKLIYGLNMNQDKIDAGGSWGLGKTSFFRMGSGIVIYYSRVKLKNSSYEERLAACLIEDSDKPNAIMPDNDRGIAWWGEKNSSNIHDKSFPVTDHSKILEILTALGVKPYTDKETGTTIIVPFIRDSEVTLTENSKEFPWEANLDEAITQAIQRWYFPRISNRHYQNYTKQSVLKASVNGELLHSDSFSAPFEWFRDLYSVATKLHEGNIDSSKNGIQTKAIHLATTGMISKNIPIGYLAYTRLNIEQLSNSNQSSFISPVKYIGNYTHTDKDPYGANILAYLRKPGMIVEYVVNDSEWLKGLSVEENSYVFAIFVPNSDGMLHKKYKGTYSTLESYLRDTENADHASWIDKITDSGRISIVNRIKRTVAKTLSTELVDTEVQSNKRTSALSRHFGKMFLPTANFGNSSSIRLTDKKTTKKKKQDLIKRSLINVTNVSFVSDNIRSLTFDATLQPMTDSTLFFDVVTSDKRYDQDAWMKTFDDSLEFPFKIKTIILTKNGNKSINQVYNLQDANTARFEIPNPDDNIHIIEGIIELEIIDLSMTPSLSMKTVEITSSKGGQ